jgi:hypothetical protein
MFMDFTLPTNYTIFRFRVDQIAHFTKRSVPKRALAVPRLIHQQTLGHKPTDSNGLGMTSNHTHTRPETQLPQIEQALRRWPESLRHAVERIAGK